MQHVLIIHEVVSHSTRKAVFDQAAIDSLVKQAMDVMAKVVKP